MHWNTNNTLLRLTDPIDLIYFHFEIFGNVRKWFLVYDAESVPKVEVQRVVENKFGNEIDAQWECFWSQNNTIVGSWRNTTIKLMILMRFIFQKHLWECNATLEFSLMFLCTFWGIVADIVSTMDQLSVFFLVYF